MMEIDKNYFLKINELVNGDMYNSIGPNFYDKNIQVDEIRSDKNCLIINQKLVDDGFAIVELNSGFKADPENIGLWLEKLFGEPPIDKNPGKLAYAKVQAEEKAKYYINSNLAQPIHTDEGYTTQYPRYAALYCYRQAHSGGHSITVPFNPLYVQLRKYFGDLVNLLFLDDSLSVQNVFGEEKKAVLIRLENGDVGISYSPVLKKMRCSEKVFELFDFITTYVHNPKNQIRLKLKDGQILLLDNCRALHGRTAFPRNDGRLLYRYWFGNRVL